MATNECNERGEYLTIAAPIAANGGIGPNSGDPLIIGLAQSPSAAMACVAETSYTPPGSLVATGNIAVKLVGVYYLSVTARNDTTTLAINPGDRVYAYGGTQDTTTGVLYGFTLHAYSTTGWYFGNALDAVSAGATATIRVRLKVGG